MVSGRHLISLWAWQLTHISANRGHAKSRQIQRQGYRFNVLILHVSANRGHIQRRRIDMGKGRHILVTRYHLQPFTTEGGCRRCTGLRCCRNCRHWSFQLRLEWLDQATGTGPLDGLPVLLGSLGIQPLLDHHTPPGKQLVQPFTINTEQLTDARTHFDQGLPRQQFAGKNHL